MPAGFSAFVPRRGLSNGHLQTIAGNFFPRPAFRLLAVSETVEVDPADGSRVLCHCHWQAEPAAARLTVVLVHGLEGSSESRYIQGIAARAWECRLQRRAHEYAHLRRHGDADPHALSLRTLRRCGRGGAPLCRAIRPGASGAGGLLDGRQPGAEAGRGVGQPAAHSCAVAAVCPAIDLAPGADALHEALNRLYEWKFLRGLLARYKRKAKLFPGIYASRKSIGPVRSIREFDDKIVARYWGFRDADDYYDRAAAARVVDRIAVPTLILHAQDDPFIRLLPETRAKLLANPHVTFIETRHGGHCAYLSRDPGNEIHWAEAAVIRFLMAVTADSYGS